MLVFVPERIYNCFKDVKEYDELTALGKKEIFEQKDFLNIIKVYQNDQQQLKQIVGLMYKHCKDEYINELNIVTSENSNLIDYDENWDPETKIYWLYNYDNGDMSYSDEANERNLKCIKIYEENFLNNPSECSDFIHTIYYLRKVYELIIKYFSREKTINEMKNFIKEETKIFDKILSCSKNESFKHIMYSKREQMYGLYLEFIGQHIKNIDETYKILWNIVNNNDFKYNYFSYFKMTFFLMFFIKYCDESNELKAKEFLDKLLELIRYSFEHRNDAVKSLNHYNKGFIDDYMVVVKFIYDIIKTYMPKLLKLNNLLKDWKVEPIEYRYLNVMLTNDEKEIVKHFNINERFYSLIWTDNKKELLKKIDNLY